MNDSRLENKIKRQDSKRRKKYKPITTGLPKGFTKSQWFLRKKKDYDNKNHNPFSFYLIF